MSVISEGPATKKQKQGVSFGVCCFPSVNPRGINRITNTNLFSLFFKQKMRIYAKKNKNGNKKRFIPINAPYGENEVNPESFLSNFRGSLHMRYRAFLISIIPTRWCRWALG